MRSASRSTSSCATACWPGGRRHTNACRRATERVIREYQTNPDFELSRAQDGQGAARHLAGAARLQRQHSCSTCIAENLSRGQALQGVGVSGFIPASSQKWPPSTPGSIRATSSGSASTSRTTPPRSSPPMRRSRLTTRRTPPISSRPSRRRSSTWCWTPLRCNRRSRWMPDAGAAPTTRTTRSRTTPRPRSAIASHILVQRRAQRVARRRGQGQGASREPTSLAEVRKNPAAFRRHREEGSRRTAAPRPSAATSTSCARALGIPGAFSDTLFAMKDGDISDMWCAAMPASTSSS